MISSEELSIIEKQLGKDPRGAQEVSARCKYGFPLVVKNKPFLTTENGFELFPTLYWLTCPTYRVQISKIESRGGIGQFERQLQGNLELELTFRRHVADYQTERWHMLSSEEQHFLEKESLTKEFTKGIGGIEDQSHLKCLHLHFAHHIARENIIGELIYQQFSIRQCPPQKIICERY